MWAQDGSAYSRWKIGCYASEKNVLHGEECIRLTSGKTEVSPPIKRPRMHNFGGKISEKIKNVEMTVLLFFQVSWQTLWRSSSFTEWDRSKLEIPPKSQFYVNPKFCFKAKTGSIKTAAAAAAKLFSEIWKLRQEKTLFAKFAETLKGSLLMETKREKKFSWPPFALFVAEHK